MGTNGFAAGGDSCSRGPIPPTEGSIDGIAADVPFAIGDSITEIVGQEIATDQTTIRVEESSMAMRFQRPSEPLSSSSVPRTTEPTQVTAQNGVPILDSACATAAAAAEDSKTAIEAQSLGNTHSITEKPQNSAPMPWDQIEDAAPEYSLTADSQASTVAEVLPALSGCPDPPPPVARIPEPVIEMPVEGSPTVEQRPESLAGMTMDQADAGVTGSSMVGGCDGPTGNEVVSAPTEETERSPLAIEEPSSPTIEVLRTASVHPITEAPMSPVSMPWDQVEETPAPVISEAEVQGDAGIVEATQSQELFATDHALDAGTPAGSPHRHFLIYLFVRALMGRYSDGGCRDADRSRSCAVSVDRRERGRYSIDGRAGSTATSTPLADPSETAWLSLAPPPLESLASLASDSPPLSAPMPWEQIEVEDVAIPRQDPEPEFGPVSTDVGDSAQDATVVLPAEEDGRASVSAMPLLADETVVDSAIRIETPSTPEFRILALDAPIELHQQPIPIHIPAEAIEPVEESILAEVFEPELPAEARDDSPVERPLRLAGSEARATLDQEQPAPGVRRVTDGSRSRSLVRHADSVYGTGRCATGSGASR